LQTRESSPCPINVLSFYKGRKSRDLPSLDVSPL